MASGVELVKSGERDNESKVGVGVAFTGLTGLSLYADTSYDNFAQSTVAFGRYGTYAITGDYAFAYRAAISSIPSITPFWALGIVLLHDQNNYWPGYASVDTASSTYVGARLPLGLNFVIPKTPIQLAAELAPSLLLTPSTYGYVQGSASLRVLF